MDYENETWFYFDNMTTDVMNFTNFTTTVPTQVPKSFLEILMGFQPFRISKRMYPIHVCVLLVFGCIGNMLAFATMMRKSMRSMSSSVYVIVLSLTDTFTMIGFLIGMLIHQYYRSTNTTSFCQVYFFLLSFSSMTSSWTVVTMSFERVLVVTFPLKAPTLTSRTKAIVAECIIAFFIILHNIYVFWVGIRHPDTYTCQYKAINFMGIWSIYDACMSFYIPLILIFIMNGVIIIQMKRSQNLQKSMMSKTSDSKPKSKEDATKPKKATNATNQITAMLLSVSIAYFLFMSPYGMFQIYFTYMLDPSKATYADYANIYLALQVVQMLWEVNHSINIVLYSLTGRKFRNEMLSMLTCGKYSSSTRSKKSQLYSTSGTVASNNSTAMSTISKTK